MQLCWRSKALRTPTVCNASLISSPHVAVGIDTPEQAGDGAAAPPTQGQGSSA